MILDPPRKPAFKAERPIRWSKFCSAIILGTTIVGGLALVRAIVNGAFSSPFVDPDGREIADIQQAMPDVAKTIMPTGKDFWDKISASTPLIIALFITAGGTYLGAMHNLRQDKLAEVKILEKYKDLLASDKPVNREFAYGVFGTLGYGTLALKLISITGDQAGTQVVESIKLTNPRFAPEVNEAFIRLGVIIRGKISTWGGPTDLGVTPDEGLSLVSPESLESFKDYFLPTQPPGTTGLARRLDTTKHYIAARWNYKTFSREYLQNHKVTVSNPRGGKTIEAQPVDNGPIASSGRVADLSPGLAYDLGLHADDEAVITIPIDNSYSAPK
jgi:hypothetical protein